MSHKEIIRRQLHNKFCEKRGSKKEQIGYVFGFLQETLELNHDEEAKSQLADHLKTQFFCPYFKRWQECCRIKQRFESKYKNWLDQIVKFPGRIGRNMPSTSSVGGRPEVTFEESCDRSKRRKTADIRSNCSVAELSFATHMALRASGKKEAALLVKTVTDASTPPNDIRNTLQSLKPNSNKPLQLTLDKTVAVLVAHNLTKNVYESLRRLAVQHNHELFPPYYKVLQAKQEAYPEGLTFSDRTCEVPLQELLDHTCHRIIKASNLPRSAIDLDAPTSAVETYTLHCKWGFDGSSGHSAYKQTWQEDGISDQSIFATSLVPLRLVNNDTGNVEWKNKRPSSTRFCRPLRLQWIHETDEIARKEEEYIGNQIKRLHPFQVDGIQVTYNLMLTMVDGKVCNSLAEVSSMRCYICDATISHLNDLETIKTRPIKTEMCRFGLSILHAHIRFFECILHISYRLDFKEWKATKKNGTEQLMKKRKRIVQDNCRSELGLIVDVPKPGYGTSNDGNTARRFFENPQKAASATGVDEGLISRFGCILTALSTGHELNIEAFRRYCWETAELYVHLYRWYYMPPSVHKILAHGASVMAEFILPIGELSEEALEARNKDIKKYREFHARKSSRLRTNEDIFRRLLLSSDPLLTELGGLPKKKSRALPTNVKDLLVIEDAEDDRISDMIRIAEVSGIVES